MGVLYIIHGVRPKIDAAPYIYINVRSVFNKLPGGEKRRQPVVEEQQLCYELFLCHSRTHSTEMAEERNAVVVKILAVVSDRVQFTL